MTIQSTAVSKGLTPPNASIPPVNPKDGSWTTAGLSLIQQMFNVTNGLTPTVTCNATFAANVYTLTPVAPAPLVPGYVSYWSFAFVAPADSTGLISATVMPNTGGLATLAVYKDNGATQADSGDILAGSFYILYYVDTMGPTGSTYSGFVLK